jgi:EXS family
MAFLSTIYSYSWDIVMDWGLLRGTTPERRWLRDRLKFPKRFYYFSMATNLLLRFTWLLTLIP